MTGAVAGLSVFSCGIRELVFSLFCLRLRVGTVLYSGDVGIAGVRAVSDVDDMLRDAESSSREEEAGGAKLERSSVESVRVTAAGFGGCVRDGRDAVFFNVWLWQGFWATTSA